MGVKEYKFLTKTMKTISVRSNKLEKAKSLLPKTENSLKDSRASARSVRAKVKRAEVPIRHIPERSEWGTVESLGKEIIATKSKLKKAKLPLSVQLTPRAIHDRDWAESGDRGLIWLILYPVLWVGISINLGIYLDETGVTNIAGMFVDDMIGFSLLAGLIPPYFLIRLYEKYASWKRLPSHQIQTKLNILLDREEILLKEERKRSSKDSKLKELKKELSELESDIEDSDKLRVSTKKEIKLLEKEIPQLWDSIAHLIPFSTALEKA